MKRPMMDTWKDFNSTLLTNTVSSLNPAQNSGLAKVFRKIFGQAKVFCKNLSRAKVQNILKRSQNLFIAQLSRLWSSHSTFLSSVVFS